MAAEIKNLEALFDKKLKPLFSKFDDLNVKVDEAICSLSFVSAKYDELNAKATNMEASIKELKDENTMLKSDIASMKDENNVLKSAQDELEQYGRRECIEIRGIPLVPDENTNEIVIKLASVLGVHITEADISISHRLGSPAVGSTRSGRSFGTASVPAIIVKFIRRDVRDKLYTSRSKLINISLKDLGFTRHVESKVFMAESLTKKRKNLFKACLEKKREIGFQFIWTRYGKIYLRKDKDSSAMLIESTQQLQRLTR